MNKRMKRQVRMTTMLMSEIAWGGATPNTMSAGESQRFQHPRGTLSLFKRG